MSESDNEKPIRTIPAFKYADDWDEITKLDVHDDAFFNRMNSLEALLENNSDLTKGEISLALAGFPSKEELRKQEELFIDVVHDASEKAAKWARSELSKLRKLESEARDERDKNIVRTKSEAPVLSGDAISRLELSDLAMTILTTVEEPGEELTLLIIELLNVDRHRRSNAENNDPSFNVAAQIIAQYPNTKTTDLAILLGKDKATIYRWKKMPEFDEKIKMYDDIFSGKMRKRMESFKNRNNKNEDF